MRFSIKFYLKMLNLRVVCYVPNCFFIQRQMSNLSHVGYNSSVMLLLTIKFRNVLTDFHIFLKMLVLLA